MATIRIILPFHLRNLAHVGSEVTLPVEDPVTQRSVLDALEAQYPMLRGAIRVHETLQRRNARRWSVSWSRIAPRSMGYCASKASSTDRWVTGSSTGSVTSLPTCARFRRWNGSIMRIVAIAFYPPNNLLFILVLALFSTSPFMLGFCASGGRNTRIPG